MTLIQADAIHLPYPDKLFHACVTSPPYWSIRKYLGNDKPGSVGLEPLFDCGAWKKHFPEWRLKFGKDGKVIKYMVRVSPPQSIELCGECHVCRMIGIGREVWRVGRDDFVFWMNYADCFVNEHLAFMPAIIAKAMQADGWIVRNDLVWFKRNPMPESVAGWRWERPRLNKGERATNQYQVESGEKQGAGVASRKQREAYFETEWEYEDDYVLRKSSWRHTRTHEYIFQLVKKMNYFCNQEVVREGVLPESQKRASYGFNPIAGDEHNAYGDGFIRDGKPCQFSGRNPRSVLDVPTAPYKGAHYATFPPKLIAPLIRASVPRRCCPECGQAWAPVVEIQRTHISDVPIRPITEDDHRGDAGNPRWKTNTNVVDYRPTCECGHKEFEPGIVLDIFAGSGTVPMVANELGVRSVGMDISYEYLDEQVRYRAKWGEQKTKTDDLPLFEEPE